MNKATTKLLSTTVGVLTVVQGLGTALATSLPKVFLIVIVILESSYITLTSLFLGLNLILIGVWLLFQEYNPFVAPFDMAKWTPFLQSQLGKAFVYQFLAFLSVGSYFGPLWNTFAFWWQLGVAIIFALNHVSTSQSVPRDGNQESLLMHDYQKLL
ncbi:hypothetical protein Ae201684P_008332 [Aphanomyces euteiches]|nr:hypothetical protein Ae201684P_008332 [Aphanomyces euteiches]KAH9131854.1 hypothetical protein AeRB84_021569 [Aphanomyces euteiches]